jgi:hypothetical protein
LILVASPAKLGRAQQSLAGLGRAWQDWTDLAGLDRICSIYFKLEYIMKKPPVMIYLYTNIYLFVFDCCICRITPYPTPLLVLLPFLFQFPF